MAVAIAHGLSLADLNELTVGFVCDLIAARSGKYERMATQADIDTLGR